MNNQCDLNLLHPYIRVINASTENNLDFFVFNTKISSLHHPGDNSQYHKCERGPTTFKVVPEGSDSALTSLGINLEIGKVYDVCIVGEKDNISLFAIENKVTKSNLEYGHLRVCNLSKNHSNLDVLADGVCFAADFQFLDVSDYIEMMPKEYNFEIKERNSELCQKIGKFTIKPGKYNSLFASPHRS